MIPEGLVKLLRGDLLGVSPSADSSGVSGSAWGGPPMLNSGPPPPRPPFSSLDAALAGSALGADGSAASPSAPSSPSGLVQCAFLRREADLALVGVDAQDLHLDLVADLDDVLGVLDLVVGQLGDVQQAFQAGLQLDEDAEVGDLGDLALDDLAGLVAAGDVGLPTGRRPSA